jgi:hypothetical protein
MDLSKYTTYRRQVLEAQRAALVANGSGITTGRLMGFDQKAKVTIGVLDELDELAAWLDAREPDYVAPLTEEEKIRWRWAKAHDLEVPEEIAEQL